MAGYSRTPLAKKLGIKGGARLVFVCAPETLADEIGPLPEGATVMNAPEAPIDLAVLFVDDREALKRDFAPIASCLAPNGILWVGWPKKSSGVATDLYENYVRDHGLTAGLVDVKVCAIDATWSALKFVIRLRDRPGRP